MPAAAVDVGMSLRMEVADLRADLDQARSEMRKTRDHFRDHAESIRGSLEVMRPQFRAITEATRGLGAAFGGVKGEAVIAITEILRGFGGAGGIAVGIAAAGVAVGALTEHFTEVKKAAKEAQDFANSTADTLISFQNQQADGYETTTKQIKEQIVLLKDGAIAARAYGVAQLDSQLAILKATADAERLTSDKADTDRLEAKNAYDLSERQRQAASAQFSGANPNHDFINATGTFKAADFEKTDIGKTLTENAEKSKQKADSSERDARALEAQVKALREQTGLQDAIQRSSDAIKLNQLEAVTPLQKIRAATLVELDGIEKMKVAERDRELAREAALARYYAAVQKYADDEHKKEAQGLGASLSPFASDQQAAQKALEALRIQSETAKGRAGGTSAADQASGQFKIDHPFATKAQIEDVKKYTEAIQAATQAANEHTQRLQNIMGLVQGFSSFMAESFLAPLQEGFKGIGQILDGLKHLLASVVAKLAAAAVAAFILSTILGGLNITAIGSGASALSTNFSSLFSHFGGFAGGGPVSGPGSGTSDSVMARLSAGEYVMPAAAVQRWGVGFMDGVASRGYAGGGLVHGGGGGPGTTVNQYVMAFDAPAASRAEPLVGESMRSRFSNRQGQLLQRQISSIKSRG